jgi:UPF0755 protein
MAKRKSPDTKRDRIPKKNQVSKLNTILILSLSILLIIGCIFFYVGYAKPLGLTFKEAYKNIASPNVRYVRIDAGMRREEVAERFAKTLGWTAAEKSQFLVIHTKANNNNAEGYFFPDTYVLGPKAKPEVVSTMIVDRFTQKIVARKAKMGNDVINLDTAIKIASIIQREAGAKDARIVSGVIWNRIFQGMSLDMDATLQYAKGDEKKWWPKVVPADKYIDSPFNTYKNKGLPPAAISNPGETAIWAALNPIETKSIFYIHDSDGVIHTARTYKEHVANIDRYY